MAAMDMANIYRFGASEKVKDLEAELENELAELKAELEQGYMPVKITSSVPIPERPEHFSQERKFAIKRALEVGVARPLCTQAEQMKTEMDSCEKNEYTVSSLPVLLHQHFSDRIQHLIHLRHLYMLRWRRFCEHTSKMEALYPEYNERLTEIIEDYKDSTQRAYRLSVSREALMLDKPESAVAAINVEDLLIYLRWLVCHLHSIKRFNQFLKVLQWLPITHKALVAPSQVNQEEPSRLSDLSSRYHDNKSVLKQPDKSRSTSAKSGASSLLLSPTLNTKGISPNTFTPVPSAGGLVATRENRLHMPLQTTKLEYFKDRLLSLINQYNINFNVNHIENNADEMEMFGVVSGNFKQIFEKQEKLGHLNTYDTFKTGKESSDINVTFRKEANWCEFVSLQAERDPQQENIWAEIHTGRHTDKILKAQANFVKINNCKKVEKTLKRHATLVQDMQPLRAACVTSHTTPHNTASMWKKIYSNPDIYTNNGKDEGDSVPDFDERDLEIVNFGAGRNKRKDSYDYVGTVQMMGLDEGDNEKPDVVSTHGAYLSYLFLQHLHIRDKQAECLAVLNYFRSLERTLTINDQGLINSEDSIQRGSFQNHHVGTEMDGGAGGGGGLGFHGYLHNTPADFKMNESDFIQFSEVKNHDDFYTIEHGHIDVIDQKGYKIVYDKAIDDLRSLESDLLLVCSFFIEKDRDLRSAANSQNEAGDFDISSSARNHVDRYVVLLDIWMNEAAYQQGKRELIDCYFEAYQHVVDRDERRRLAQVIVNILNQRPRFDLQSDYFVATYQAECSLLQKQAELVTAVLDRQIEHDREYVQRITRDASRQRGLPERIIAKQPVAINLSRPALRNIYMLECHPTLAMASRIPAALRHAYWELNEAFGGSTLMKIMMEKMLIEAATTEWQCLPAIGSSFTTQLHKDLFSETFVEDPIFQCNLALESVKQEEEMATGRRSHKERQTSIVETFGRLMNIITLRHRMIEACWETELLSKIYNQQAVDMGFPEFHLYLRFVQFEFASFKEDAGKRPPTFMATIQEDDSDVDKYAPSCLYLAVHELDEGHVGRFSFHNQDSMKLLMRPAGMASFQVVLKTQVAHRNSLLAAIQQVSTCDPLKVMQINSGRVSPTETRSEKSSLTSTSGTTVIPGQLTSNKAKVNTTSEAFFSLQLEKSACRDLMLNDFVTLKMQLGTVLKNSEELEKVKRKLISEFCEKLHLRLSHASMRSQLLAYYTSVLRLLSKFPKVREIYFVLGEPNEVKAEDDIDSLSTDPRVIKKRPRRLLSSNGQHVLNLWFIPHFTEVIAMYKTLDDSLCAKALEHSLHIVSSLHDILQYLAVLANLTCTNTNMSHSTNWGSTEAIGSELREIQKEIESLAEPSDPQSVIDLLALRRDVMFLQYDMAVRSCMPDTFLAMGNISAYKRVVSNAQYAMTAISNAQVPSLMATHLAIPEPLESRDSTSRVLFPWRTYINSSGPYPGCFDQWFRIESFMSLCLSGLPEIDRNVANGEILGVNLLMEDVLRCGYPGRMLSHDLEPKNHSQAVSRGETVESGQGVKGQSVTSDLKAASYTLAISEQQSLVKVQQPLQSYRLLLFFLVLWKCLIRLQSNWAQTKLHVEKIDTPTIYREYCKLYRTEILLPSLQSVARRLGQADLYDDLVQDTGVYVMPQGASEIEVRLKQLLRLLENLECHMITEVRKRVSRELSLAVSERLRDEEALPIDLWKRAVMKESFTLNRPHVAEQFVHQLMSEVKETDTTVTFESKHLLSCLSELARNIMTRERYNFDSYSMYYENMLRIHHQLLYQREQEVKALTEQLKQAQADMRVSVQCLLADEAHDLLMEITALRCKVMEMRELSLNQERDIREKVRDEFEDLIHSIFNSTFLLRSKFDEFRSDLEDDVMEKVTETRREAVDALSKLQQKFSGNCDKEKLMTDLQREEQIQELLHENNLLNKAIVKMKAMSTWRQNIRTQNFVKNATDLHKKANSSKKDNVEIRMLAQEEIILLRQQVLALRKSLAATEKDCSQVRTMLETEMKVKAEREHEEAERKRNRQQLEAVKMSSMDKLIDELVNKELTLKKQEAMNDRSNTQTKLEVEKTRRNLEVIKKRSNQERNLKLDAFQRLDVLQYQVYDLESCLMNKPGHSSSASKHRSRANSAQTQRQSRSSTPAAQFHHGFKLAINRSMTPFNEMPTDMSIYWDKEANRSIRPKTVGSMADYLLADLQPGTQQRQFPS